MGKLETGAKKEVSIFLPMYNEERILRKSVLEVCSSAAQAFEKFEIVIVDDSSKDRSGEIGKKLEKSNKRVRYMRFENGPSRRENLALALARGKGDIIIFSDTDLAADISALTKLAGTVRAGYDVAVGSRYIRGSKTVRKPFRRVVSFFYNSFINLYFGSKIRDHNCGFKAFRREAIIKLVRAAGYDKSFRRGWFWDAEILIMAQRMDYRIKEVPVNWKEGKKSTFSLIRELRMLPYMIKLKKRLPKKSGQKGDI